MQRSSASSSTFGALAARRSCPVSPVWADDPLPGLLAQWFWGGPLRAHAGPLGMMALNRQKQGARLVIGRAKDDGGAAFGKFNKDGVGPGDAMRMDDDCGDLIKGHAADGLAAVLNEQKATITRKVAAILADIYDLIQNAPDTLWVNVPGDLGDIQAIFGGPGSLMRPISSMITRRAPDLTKDEAFFRM